MPYMWILTIVLLMT